MAPDVGDDSGGYLELVGARVDGWFALERMAPEHGPDVRQRMVFRDISDNAFRWTWDYSRNDGADWQTRWEISYTRRA